MEEDKFFDNIIHQGEIAHNLSKLKKEELIIGYQREICLTEELQHKIVVLNKALEELSEHVYNKCIYCKYNYIDCVLKDNQECPNSDEIMNFVIDQARKELEG